MSRQGIAFDYNSPAELYLSRPRRHTDYRRFATAAEAIHYAVDELRTRRSLSAWMQVGEERFNKNEINRLYDDDDYPLRTPLSPRHCQSASLQSSLGNPAQRQKQAAPAAAPSVQTLRLHRGIPHHLLNACLIHRELRQMCFGLCVGRRHLGKLLLHPLKDTARL